MQIKLYNTDTGQPNNTPLRHTCPNLEGFLSSLEQYYFADVSILTYKVMPDHIGLAMELKCPMRLLEVFAHFNKKQWGYCGESYNPLQKTLHELYSSTHLLVDVTELNLILEDTLIIIKKVAFRSIVDQFNDIVAAMAKHYVFVSKGLEESPYEIYLPVYEDVYGNPTSVEPFPKENRQDYYTYWGIYMDSEPEAQVYDVQSRVYVPASLDLCILEGDDDY